MTVLIGLIKSQMTKHIYIQSDHPTSITNSLSQLSSSKHTFYETIPYYEQRLASCEYKEKLTYQQQGKNTENNKNIGKN